MTTPVNSWDRQSQEHEICWTAFQRYRDLPNPRPALKDFAITIGHPASTVLKWAQLWDWTTRLEGWDRKCDSHRQAATLTAVERMANDHIEIAQLGLAIVRKSFTKMAKLFEEENWSHLKPQEAARILDVCAKLERLSRGEATERVEGGVDYSRLSDEDLAQLERIAAKTNS